MIRQAANPEMLIIAREVRRMTQTELAHKSEIHQGRISRYEAGLKSIPEDDLEALAKALAFPVDFFYQEGERHGAYTAEIFHRKRQTVSSTDLKGIDSLIDVYWLVLKHLLKGVTPISKISIPTYRVDEFDGNIEAIAAAVRAKWQMPSGPVNNLIKQLEAASCMIFSYDLGTDKIDEVTQWVEPMPPIILINSRAPGDRLRFSLAHALGHLVMHHNQTPYPKNEDEADQFAAAFLMPADEIRPDLTPVTIDHMLQLKPYWKVSMQALIRRAHYIGEISDRRYTSLFEMLSRAGYRKREPMPIEPEKPEQVRRLLDFHRKELNHSEDALEKLSRINREDFRAWYLGLTVYR